VAGCTVSEHPRTRDGDGDDYESTQAILARRAPGLVWIPEMVRKKLTPGALWLAITMLAGAIGYVVNAQHDLHRHQESIADLQASRLHDRELLEKIDMELAVVNTRIGDVVTEVDRQREWRERIEGVAEEQPHAAKRRLAR
jgi:hypothetical protein